MKWIGIAAIVLSPAILYALVLIGKALKRRFLPARCPRCSKRGLRTVVGIPACGGKGAVRWSYHLCPMCNAKLRLKYGVWSDAPEDEWLRMVPPNLRV